jgi:hypothetical protein
MKTIVNVGLSASDMLLRDGVARGILDAVDYIELKVITPDEARRYGELTDKPLFFHVQYTGNGEYYLPAVMDLGPHMPEISEAYRVARPSFLSIHFGLSSPRVSMDSETFMAVASEPPLEKKEILRYLETNLTSLKAAFPEASLLIENVEFIPEAASRGAYRHVQEASFFGSNVVRWQGKGILDGTIFDVAHGIIAAANHPFYNGLGTDPLETGEEYVRRLKDLNGALRAFETYISEMPLQLVREIHLSGASRLPNGMWVDSHGEIGETELTALKILLEELKKTGVEYLPVTLEYTGDARKVTPQIARLRKFFEEHL